MTGEQQGRVSAHGRLVRAFLASTAALALVVGALGAYGYASFVAAQSVVSTFPTSAGPSGSARDFGPCVRNVCNYLILGSDSRAGLPPGQVGQFGTNRRIGGSTRSDVIILVHTDPRQDKSVILSFPRDLWVSIPGHGENKINSAFEGGLNGGGPQLVARTVENLTGLRINHVLYVNLAGFEGVVKALGGVDMCIPANLVNTPDGRVYDVLTGLDVRPGCQLLDPLQALAYVRTRHLPCDFVPDFSRIGRQQQFLRAVLNRLLQPSEITKAPSLIKPIAHNLVTDPGFKLADIIYLVKQLQGIGEPAAQAQADFRAVPGTTATVTVSWSSVPLSVVKMQPSAEALFKTLRSGQRLPPNVGVQLQGTARSPANIPTLVVDHDSAGKAAGVASTLSESGFDITPGNTTYTESGLRVKGSALMYAPGSLSDAQVVAQYFPGLRLVQAPKHALPHGTMIAIVISASYRPQRVGQGPPPSGHCVSPA